jgi:hypothetical protein
VRVPGECLWEGVRVFAFPSSNFWEKTTPNENVECVRQHVF